MSQNSSPLLVIVGQTASGKSHLAIELAERLNGEIICADSWTIRREANIGTDKPSPVEQSRVRHHLTDIIEPCADFTVAVFKDLAKQAIKDISSRGKLPIMVGGSGLYIDSVIYDYHFLSPSSAEMRAELNGLSVTELLAKIDELDLPLGDQIDKRNKRRLIRLIESGGTVPKKSSLRTNTLVIGISPSREQLEQAITLRVDQMLDQGLEEEVRQLYLKYGWGCEALKGVGYKQWQQYFDGGQSLAETREQIISSTNNLAKKQRTWFKRNKSIHWLTLPLDTDSIVDLVTTKLAS